MRIFLTSIVIMLGLAAQANTVTISGHDSAYALTTIEWVTKTDDIAGNEQVLAIAQTDSAGAFRVSFELGATRQVYAYLGIYKAFLFAEPGASYQIVLPAYSPKSDSDKLNPYFQYTLSHLGIENVSDDELNLQIRMFEDSFLPYLNKHVTRVFSERDFSALDDELKRLDKPFRNSKNEFFNQYRTYRYGLIRFLAFQQKSKSISDEYFIDKPVLHNNPAYWELFNKVYHNYFEHISRTEKGKKISVDISETKEFDALRETLKADSVLHSDELIDLIILKGLYREFYDDNYSRSALLDVILSYIDEEKTSPNQQIAHDIYNKVTKLLVGHEPPFWELYNQDSTLVNSKSFPGKYIYLNFCTCFSYSCLNEFIQLQLLQNKLSDHLQIVTIIFDDDVQIMKDFLSRSGYSWTFLHYGKQDEILKDYDIRAFPTYYLIGPDGKLRMSPAPTPNEQFEARLFKVLREDGVL